MADHPLFTVDIVTPEAVIWSGQAEFVSAMTTEGEIGVFAGHEPTMAALSTGAVIVGIHGGFLQIARDTVTLLTDRAEMTDGGRSEAIRLAQGLRDDTPGDAGQ